jgi:hypothetical protein
MNLSQDLDPRVKGFEKKVKVIGVGLVAAAAAVVVAITGGAIIVAGLALIGAIVLVNVVPVVARRMAIWRQSKLTQIDEEFSEETLRIDEQQEVQRVHDAEEAFTTMRSELEGAIEELRGQLNGASPDEQEVIKNQITTMEGLITEQGEALRERQVDLKELKRVNGLLIAMDRAARAMNKAQGAERNPKEQQSLVTARNAIKTRMRAAIAGQQVEAMRRDVNGKASPPGVAQLKHQPSESLGVVVDIKEKVNVPTRR